MMQPLATGRSRFIRTVGSDAATANAYRQSADMTSLTTHIIYQQVFLFPPEAEMITLPGAITCHLIVRKLGMIPLNAPLKD